MLKLGEEGFLWSRCSFRDFVEGIPESTAKIYVSICIDGHLDSSLYAQIDTGAAWSVLDPAVAESFGLLEVAGEPTQLHTRFGLIKGHLVRLPVTFLSEEGDALDTYGTFFISPDWPPGHTFLGYSGLLDSIRFALDPQANHFYFGPGV
jgi:hypothetical protein